MRGREGKRERQTDRQTDRQTNKHTDEQAYIQTDIDLLGSNHEHKNTATTHDECD